MCKALCSHQDVMDQCFRIGHYLRFASCKINIVTFLSRSYDFYCTASKID